VRTLEVTGNGLEELHRNLPTNLRLKRGNRHWSKQQSHLTFKIMYLSLSSLVVLCYCTVGAVASFDWATANSSGKIVKLCNV
jgi:hypothetical protein